MSFPRAVVRVANWWRGWFFGPPSGARRRPQLPAYLARKHSLPNTFTADDWQRALEYWEHKCAVCGRPRGLWHTLAKDHWLPLTSPDCPGTVATNILPLCHGEGGCNNSKSKKDPESWLIERLGKRRAARKRGEIQAYFDWVRSVSEPPGCPRCGEPVQFFAEDEVWECTGCLTQFDRTEVDGFEECPDCQCWMIEFDGQFHCSRCKADWSRSSVPPVQICPGCGRGVLIPMTNVRGTETWWGCTVCAAEWVYD